jgi:predicted unusual protein kinase regulating ubiquinone biosynthesis (AarF/ABC1/UbiB family)
VTPRRIPSGLWSRARATSNIALQVARRSASRLWTSSSAKSDEADARLGEAIFAQLDDLKGMAMKVGQILSYMDTGLPPALSDKLAQLQQGFSPLPFEVMAPVVEAELNCALATVFSEFEEEALAAASIGQVHRARLLDGKEVAVKIQYPAIRETLSGDFSQMRKMATLAGVFSAVDGQALVGELQKRVLEECDYAHEARWQQYFSQFFQGDPDLVVPKVHAELSTAAVLTTDFYTGEFLEHFSKTAPLSARNRAARALVRLFFKPLFARQVIHADPHPGNQLYQSDGSLVILDFGCVRQFDDAFMAHYVRLTHGIIHGDRPLFREAAQSLGLAPRPDRIDFDELFRLHAWLFEPVLNNAFRFTTEWWKTGLTFTRPSAKNARHQGFPPEWIWLQRGQWGLWAVLKKLQPQTDLGPVFQDALLQWPGAGGSL